MYVVDLLPPLSFSVSRSPFVDIFMPKNQGNRHGVSNQGLRPHAYGLGYTPDRARCRLWQLPRFARIVLLFHPPPPREAQVQATSKSIPPYSSHSPSFPTQLFAPNASERHNYRRIPFAFRAWSGMCIVVNMLRTSYAPSLQERRAIRCITTVKARTICARSIASRSTCGLLTRSIHVRKADKEIGTASATSVSILTRTVPDTQFARTASFLTAPKWLDLLTRSRH
ncbi:hypothetical protein B0H16DRAFT_1723133 [Mycena metata]|uniref:Uncharacterized protein n=1 Tax=Mycena metata TaxID=1033252 RepID=A0AAD7IZD4_9AGAR|nr:hypothetical protein B0H16DRAFT_1723133 [Mycena metata]